MGGSIKSHRDLRVWQETYALALDVLRASDAFPRSQVYGLTSQVRRCAVSVPSNIAEGFGRGSRADYLRYLKIARGSLFELDTQLSLSKDMEYLKPTTYRGLSDRLTECSKMLAGLIKRLEASD